MLMGRGTYEYFADVMPNQTGPYADAINAIRKYVFSSGPGQRRLEQLHDHSR
jgi:dihydrofolate reductase